MRTASQSDPHTGLAIRILLAGALIAGGIFAFQKLQTILLPLLFALLLTALLSPAVERLERRGMRRPVAAGSVLLTFLVVLLAGLFYVSAPLIDQAADVTTQIERGIDQLPDVARSIGLDEAETQEMLRNAGTRIRENLGSISSAVSSGALTIAFATVSVAFGIFFTFVLLAYLLFDGRGFWNGVLRLVKTERRERVALSGARAWNALKIFVRSQAAVALFDAAGIAIGLLALGIPFVLPLATMTFALSFVPYIGATLSGLLVGLVALSTDGPTAMLAIIAIAALVQFVEGNFVYPLLIGARLRMHPITVLLAVGTGAALLGVLGAFFATPLLATAAAATGHLTGLDPPAPEPQEAAPDASPAAPAPDHGVAHHDPAVVTAPPGTT